MRLNARASLLVLLLLAAGLTVPAQDLSSFLSKPPAPGAWASYRVQTSWPGSTKTERLSLAVTGEQTVGGLHYLWIELWPMDLLNFKDGVMRLLLKAAPSPEEALNPFLQAQSITYQESKEDPFALSEGALSFLHGQAKKLKVEQKKSPLPPENVTSTKGATFECTRFQVSTYTRSQLFGRTDEITETGEYWFSEATPFQLVKAEFERVQVRNGKESRRRTVTITLREGDLKGAVSQFTKPVTREKGLLALLLH